jgi:hypothetical protein
VALAVTNALGQLMGTPLGDGFSSLLQHAGPLGSPLATNWALAGHLPGAGDRRSGLIPRAAVAVSAEPRSRRGARPGSDGSAPGTGRRLSRGHAPIGTGLEPIDALTLGALIQRRTVKRSKQSAQRRLWSCGRGGSRGHGQAQGEAEERPELGSILEDGLDEETQDTHERRLVNGVVGPSPGFFVFVPLRYPSKRFGPFRPTVELGVLSPKRGRAAHGP